MVDHRRLRAWLIDLPKIPIPKRIRRGGWMAMGRDFGVMPNLSCDCERCEQSDRTANGQAGADFCGSWDQSRLQKYSAPASASVLSMHFESGFRTKLYPRRKAD